MFARGNDGDSRCGVLLVCDNKVVLVRAAIRVKADLVGDASREELDEIVQWANRWSPVANTLRNNVAVTASLAEAE